MQKKYIFGPVASRRFGMSLGIDLVPHKTCTIDCVYCECGATTNLTTLRAEYYPTNEIINEIDNVLANYSGTPIDYITLTGSGEPTLHSHITDIIDHLKIHYPQFKTAILTNGTLLCDPQVRKDISQIDLAKISIDCVTEDSFTRINRPAAALDLKTMLDGIVTFCEEYTGKVWIEVFIIEGINDSENEINILKNLLTKIKPDIIHLNSLDRIGVEDWVRPASEETLQRIANALSPLPTVIVKRAAATAQQPEQPANITDAQLCQDITALLRRRPSTIQDMMTSFGCGEDMVKKVLKKINVVCKDGMYQMR